MSDQTKNLEKSNVVLKSGENNQENSNQVETEKFSSVLNAGELKSNQINKKEDSNPADIEKFSSVLKASRALSFGTYKGTAPVSNERT